MLIIFTFKNSHSCLIVHVIDTHPRDVRGFFPLKLKIVQDSKQVQINVQFTAEMEKHLAIQASNFNFPKFNIELIDTSLCRPF